MFHFFGTMSGQEEYLKNTLKSVDQIIGQENTGLYNGTKYIELYRTINEHHKFFKSSEFLFGDLIYGDQYYGNVNLKYDLDADDVLLDIGYLGKFPILKLYKSRISEFSLDGKKFINVGASNPDVTKGFHEVVWDSDDLKLLKKHKKEKLKKLSIKLVYYEFFDENSYFFEYKNVLHPLNKRGDLLKVFPEFKKEIKQLYKKRFVKINPKANYISIFGELQRLLEK
ncbi:MAG: hypothetical protein AB8B59_10730 [Maribacter sp.]